MITFPTINKPVKKIVILVFSLFLLRLITGCIFRCNCPDTEILDINFNKLIINNINNSDGYIGYHHISDSVPAKAIGFNILVCDSIYYENPDYYYVQNRQHFQPFIKGAYAWQCFCNEYDYHPNGNIIAIRVNSLFDFNAEYPAGSDISHLYVALAPYYDFNTKGMYASIDELLVWIQNNKVLDLPEIELSLFLKEAPTSDSIQLVFRFEFDDNSFLDANSPVIYPIN